MQIRPFLEKLPTLYQDWGKATMQSTETDFDGLLATVQQPTTANFLTLLRSAAGCLDEGEVICEIGCWQGANLVGMLAGHPDRLAYGVDLFSTQAEGAEPQIEKLQENLRKFEVGEQVCLAHQTVEAFFADLRAIETEDRFGLLVYNFEPDYRQVLMSLLLARDFLADRALLVVSNTDQQPVRQAVADFLQTQSQAQVLFDWQARGRQVFGGQGLGIIAWDGSNGGEVLSPLVMQEEPVIVPRVNLQEAGEKKKVLHVGCGPYHPEALPLELRTKEWQEIRLDINPAVNPDILGTITDLSGVPDQSVDAVYSSHNIEHIYTHEVPIALQEFKRVLKPGGRVVITCPDIQAVAVEVAQGNLENILYFAPAAPVAAIDILYGWRPFIAQGNYYMAHKTAFTEETLKTKLLQTGFIKVETFKDNLNLWAYAHSG